MRITKYILILFISILALSCKNISKKIEKIGDRYYEMDNLLKAIKYYNISIIFNELNKDAIHSAGRVSEDLENYIQAIKYYSTALEIDTLFALAHRSRGFAYYSVKDYHSAITDYLKSLEIDSLNASAFRNAASIYKELCDYKKARDFYYKSFKLFPNHYGGMADLAGIEFDLGNYDSCINLCYKVIGNLTSGQDSPHGTLGLAYTAIKKYDSAIVHLNKALEYKSLCHYYGNRGYALSAQGKEEEAILDYNLAIELDSTNPNFYLNRADSKYFLARYIQAIRDYNKAISLAELYNGYNCGICFNNRAHAKLAIGDTIGYEEDLTNAKNLGYPDNYNSFSNLESCFYKIIRQPPTKK